MSKELIIALAVGAVAVGGGAAYYFNVATTVVVTAPAPTEKKQETKPPKPDHGSFADRPTLVFPGVNDK